ncbi:hypothetical protein C1T17_20485 (plasmid) [Sphingobium sp. SCG-1]|uniref:DUF983 domain-containing protein n=1 Tax=Sphingobium sp. SCG-1 TaxID=2072936 RepID=UPI000CD68369|nr:hypothetical protein C1T17_20485 [Sphingobium sp. SCG-1]
MMPLPASWWTCSLAISLSLRSSWTRASARRHPLDEPMPDFTSPFDRQPDSATRRPLTGVPRRPRLARVKSFEPPSDPATIWSALWRGARNQCPACGGAALFASFLKPVAQCSACQEDWTLHNADDFPPYIVILVIGHVVVTGMTSVEVAFHPPMWVQLAIWMLTIIALAVGLIQPVKGGVIAFQWWHRMGGFEHRRSTVTLDVAGPDASAPEADSPYCSNITSFRVAKHGPPAPILRRGSRSVARMGAHRRLHARNAVRKVHRWPSSRQSYYRLC